jgi:hypothetical protein
MSERTAEDHAKALAALADSTLLLPIDALLAGAAALRAQADPKTCSTCRWAYTGGPPGGPVRVWDCSSLVFPVTAGRAGEPLPADFGCTLHAPRETT